MKVIRDLDWCPAFEAGTAVTFGEFDGVHRGHRFVLLEAVRAATVEGCPTVVVTFDPRSFADRATEAPPLLTDLEQKLELLEASGVDWVIELPEDRIVHGESSDVEAGIRWILDEFLVGTLNARAVIIGEDYHFGAKRRWTILEIERRSTSAPYRVVQVPVESRRTSSGDVVSAQSIRDLLSTGSVEAAAEMLGRPHEIRSEVARGERRGRTIGFPTVNLPTPPHMQVPAEGVYAGVYVRPNGERLRAAINIGRRPTFHEGADPLIEAHLLDFRGDLYGEAARLQFVARVRSEQKFDDVDALRAQLMNDIATVRDEVALR